MESWREELRHHGILGMKWGQRRFQNKDGTLTDAGKKRYNASRREQMKSTAKINEAHRLYGEKRRIDDYQEKKDWYDKFKKISISEYEKKYLGPGYDRWEAEYLYGEELSEAREAARMAKYDIASSRILEQKLDEIDITSTRYRDVKRIIKSALSESVHNSIIAYEAEVAREKGKR